VAASAVVVGEAPPGLTGLILDRIA
jgi:hypothetical protein